MITILCILGFMMWLHLTVVVWGWTFNFPPAIGLPIAMGWIAGTPVIICLIAGVQVP